MRIGKVPLTGSHIKIAQEILKSQKEILTGTMLSIDPGSTSPGWALWMSGNLVTSGVIKTKSTHKIAERLATIHEFIEGLPQADFLAIEKIGMIRGGGKAQAHRYLFWSLGAITAASRTKKIVEIPQNMWFKFRGREYTKGDEEDSILIGRTALEVAKSQSYSSS